MNLRIDFNRFPSNTFIDSRYINREGTENQIVHEAETIFINGPVGVYEQTASAEGTQRIWLAVVEAPGYSVIGGGDSVASAKYFGVADRMSYVCTAGGGMVRFMSGRVLPVVAALQRAAQRTAQAGTGP